jgi:lactate dehydrogenase-like 2-hydroxyacid dehydrogenase
MSTKIFITRNIPDIAIKILEEKGYVVDVYKKDKIISRRKLTRTLKKGGYNAVLCLLTDAIDASLFETAKSVKLYVNYASGFDNIDIVSAKKYGVTVANSPADLSAEAVAEHTIAMILALQARIVEADEFTRRGKYKGWSPMNFIGSDTRGKTLGLIGVGRIGERVAYYAKGLGFKIIYHDVSRNTKLENDGGIYKDSVDELLKESDVVSLHVPLTDSTHHLINEARLATMKPTSFLVNTSRGAVIDEKALERALRNKIISAAALDVFEFEPAIVRGLKKLQNVILTPHIASASTEARNQMAEISAHNIIDFFEGKTPRNCVTT